LKSQADVAQLRYSWWITALVALAWLALEIIENWPNRFTSDPSFVSETLIFGVALPVAIGFGPGWLARHKSEPVGARVVLPHKATTVNRQHVLVVENELFSELVKSLLCQVKDLNVASFAPRDEAELVEEIERTQPGVVVLDVATRMTDPDSLLCSLNPEMDLRVVTVSTDDNTVRVYDKQNVLITRGEDLVTIIQSWIQV
jgi:hypothetical protein